MPVKDLFKFEDNASYKKNIKILIVCVMIINRMGRKQLSMFEFKIKRKVFFSNLKMSHTKVIQFLLQLFKKKAGAR